MGRRPGKMHRWLTVEQFRPFGTGTLVKCADCGVLREFRKTSGRWYVAFIFGGKILGTGEDGKVPYPACPVRY